MKYWPIIRHLRYTYWLWRLHRHRKRYGAKWVSSYSPEEWLESVWDGRRHPGENSR